MSMGGEAHAIKIKRRDLSTCVPVHLKQKNLPDYPLLRAILLICPSFACNLEFYRSSTTKSTPIRMRNRDLHLMCFPEDPSATGSCKLNSIKHILTYPQPKPNHGNSFLAIFYHQAQLYIHTTAVVSKPGWQSRAVLAISIECHPAEFDILSLVVAQRQERKISPRSHWVLNKQYT
jgi:hypothetical protein